MKNPKVLAVIPARGGSKRFPRKNIYPLLGKPMIAYSIEAVKHSNMVTDWLVSSEDEEIIAIAKDYHAPVPFTRPDELATDNVRNIDVVLHALDYMENNNNITYDIILLIQPTSPIRKSSHIDDAVRLLHESSLTTLASVKGPFQKRDSILKKINEQGELVKYCDTPNPSDREAFYMYNASLYAVKRDFFVKNKTFISNEQIPLIMDKYHSVDVDDALDMKTAELYISGGVE
jgi:CMP-N-acetylneuraminic acid synthetase